MTTTPPKPTPITCQCGAKDDDTKWLALLVRQGLKLIVVGIEKRYNIGDEKDRRAA